MENKNKFKKRQMPPIFLIGFNKCATRSIYGLFLLSGVPSVHFTTVKGDKVLATEMYKRFKKNLPIIPDDHNNIVFFSDMEDIWVNHRCWRASTSPYTCACGARVHEPIYIANLFKTLEQQYPKAKFILNTRNMDNWLKSRINHDTGGWWTPKNYLEIISKSLNKPGGSVIKLWKEQWIQHHNSVKSYFKGEKKDKLLIFDIDKDSPEKITQFFNKFFDGKYVLNPKCYRHIGKA